MSLQRIALRCVGRQEEGLAGAAGIKPGHLVELAGTASAIGTPYYRAHSTYGGSAEKFFVEEDSLQGGTILDAYASGAPMKLRQAMPGDWVLGRLPASASAVVLGDKLISNGTGTLVLPTSAGTHTLYANTAASAAVSNTTTETAFDKSYTIPANLLVAGDVLTIKGQVIATATNSTDTLNIKLKLGSTVLVASAAVDVANNDVVFFEITVLVRTAGASGTYVAAGHCSTVGAAGTVTQRAAFVASTAIDTTATNAITVTATWSAASSGDSVRLDVLDVERSAVSPRSLLCVAQESVDNSAGTDEAMIKVRVL